MKRRHANGFHPIEYGIEAGVIAGEGMMLGEMNVMTGSHVNIDPAMNTLSMLPTLHAMTDLTKEMKRKRR